MHDTTYLRTVTVAGNSSYFCAKTLRLTNLEHMVQAMRICGHLRPQMQGNVRTLSTIQACAEMQGRPICLANNF